MDEELRILFGALCDGLRKEVRARYLLSIAGRAGTSATDEREGGLQSVLAYHLRLIGFSVQVESYLDNSMAGGRRRPDFRIWLSGSKRYLYLELKTYGWGSAYKYDDHGTMRRRIKVEIKKLSREKLAFGVLNGLVVVVFSRHKETPSNELLDAYKNLSINIIRPTSYRQIGLSKVDLKSMDTNTSYAAVGLWVSN